MMYQFWPCFFCILRYASANMMDNGPAKIIKAPQSQTILEREEAIFYCLIDGNPSISLSMLYNGMQLSNIISIPNGMMLRMSKVQMAENNSRIECIVENPSAPDKKTAYLTVIDQKDGVPNGFPRIKQQQDYYQGDVGQTMKLSCVVEGNPTPKIVWFKDNCPIDISEPRRIISKSGSLLFSRLLIEDSGVYECRAINSIGSRLSVKMQLQIRNTQMTPHWVHTPPHVEVRPGHGINLTCAARGNPTPHLRWLTQYLRPINDLSERESILLLTDITEPATYICKANNSMGTIDHNVNVRVKKIPKMPVKVATEDIGATYAMISWQQNPESETPVDSYTLIINDISSELGVLGKKQITDIHPWPKYNKTIVKNVTDLKPFTTYSVTVQAVSKILGMSDDTKLLSFQTKELPPSSPPQSVYANADTSTSINVKWGAPVEANGKITSYNVYYTKNLGDPINQWQKSETTKNNVNIVDLSENQIYHIKVNAVNRAGPGPVSDPFPIIVRPGVPPQPLNFRGAGITSSSINLIWTPPQIPKSLILLDYILKYRVVSGIESPNMSNRDNAIPISSEFTDYSLKNLLPNTLYHISLAARTVHGIGVAATMNVRTENRVPSTPKGIGAKPLSMSSIRIRWTQGSDNQETVNSFKIRVVKVGSTDSNVNEIKNVPAKEKNMSYIYEHVIKDLESGQQYKIVLWSLGQSGLSAPFIFDLVRTTTEDLIPSPPLNVRLNQLRQKNENGQALLLADIAWDPPENSHGAIVAYRVKHQLIGPPNLINSLKLRQIPIKVYSRNVTGSIYGSMFSDALGFGRLYEFSVAAINSVDIGIEAKFEVPTRESAPDSYPISIDITGITSQSVNVSWQPPLAENHNGIIINYQVLYFVYGMKNSTTRTTNTENLYACIEGLEENKLYTFQVRAFTKSGPGPWCSDVHFRTVVLLPDPPINIEAKRINERQIKVTWELSPNNNIKVVGFKIYYCLQTIPKDIESCNTLDVGPVTMVTLGNIEFYSDYQVAVKSKGIDNRYGALSNICLSKMSNVPKITDLSVKGLKCDGNVRSTQIQWNKPDIEKHLHKFLIIINGYSSFANETGKIQKLILPTKIKEVEYVKSFTKYVIELKEMEPNTVYDISVETVYRPEVTTYHHGTFQNTSCRTLMTSPQTVIPPEVLSINRSALSILFLIRRVTEKLGVIRRYYLVIEESTLATKTSNFKYSLTMLKSSGKLQMDNPTLVAEFTTEIFKRSSNISLWIGQDIWLIHSAKSVHTSDYLLLSPIILHKDKSYKTFLRACIYQEYTAPTQSDFNQCTDSVWSAAFNFEKQIIEISEKKIISNNKKQGDVFTVSIIAIIIGLGIIALISIAVGCFMKRRRPKRYYNSPQELIMNGDPSLKQALISQAVSGPPSYVPLSHSNGIVTDMDSSIKSNYKNLNVTKHPPIPSGHLADYIQALKANDNAKFTEEYESIDPGHQFTWVQSNLEINKPKNRYANVIAYDHSRVVLSTLNDMPGSDYINANYCDGYRKQNAYIATQGPLPETFEAFWRMVWESRCALIVMMTKLEERLRVKCDQYWPTRGSDVYIESGLTINHLETVELAYYTMRKFSLTKKALSDHNGNKETRDIFHFQFTGWPDHGVPDTALPLLMFIKRVRSCCPSDSGPVVVHCSAGVGRTGAYIVLDSQLSQLQHEKVVDVYGLVSRLRAQRNYMVQTEEQYNFIYDALLEASMCGNTEVSIRHLHGHVTKLKQPLPVLGVIPSNQYSTGMELEFKHLSELSTRPRQFNTANLPENRLKNRLINILPYENRRVCLQPIRNQDGSDYINASFIDGYRSQRSYIATQGPLANTITDFWRMLWQHNSSIVVMLSQLREMGREKCSQYWPTDRSATFGQIVVEPMVEYNMPSFILREFRVRHSESETHNRTIRQFQFLDWAEQGVPRSGESLIDFIGQVHKTKEQFGQEGPITVHCSAGVGRTGVFLALSIVLDRMRSEGTIDLFQTVRLLRMQRPCMIQTEDQYQFCYLTALEYLSSFDQFLS